MTNCGPVAVTDGGDSNIYFSAPSSDGICNGGISIIGRVAADGTGALTTRSGFGEAYDLAASGGKLCVPDFEGDAVRRVGESAFSVETTVAAPAGSGPEYVAVSPTGEVWVGLSVTNQVAHFPAGQNGGGATIVPLSVGQLALPGGIAFGTDGAAYVASSENSSLVKVTQNNGTSIPLPAGSVPLDLAVAADGSIWITDLGRARILHYVPPVPPAPVVQHPAPAPASPAPPPTPDKTPPVVKLEGKKTQPAGEFVTVVASCPSEACQALATGKLELKPIKGGGKPKTYPLVKARAAIPAGGKKTLKLKLSSKAKKALKPVLANGGKAGARIELRATDAAGNATVKRLSVRLTSAAPR